MGISESGSAESAVEHRAIEWAPRSSDEEFELVIMIAVAIEEMHGADRVLT
jgi:hypothetical protein